MLALVNFTGMFQTICACLALASAASAAELPPAVARSVDFTRDIEPLFESKCAKCHGPEKQKNGYRLDQKNAALTGGDEHAPNILPGNSAESPLIQFVAGLDPDVRMPPKGERLTAEEIGILRAWIDAGAVWPEGAGSKAPDPLDWWSLKPVVKPSPPGESANPIDAFLRASLCSKGLKMSAVADARTLCRRLFFDLTGLPPAPEEIDDFEQASARDETAALNQLVEKLLGSPRYGECWARHWLDVVHYADTHGYDKDQPRPNAWPYRDYVIRAINEDKPYARFVQEQVAGDVLFPGTRDGIEALGFIAAGPWDLIGHAEVAEDKVDGKIARHLDRDDMIGATIGAFCSATIQCAQCHNHKFDPITQEDYYSLQADFAALDRADKSYDFDPATAALRAQFTARKRDLEAKEKALSEQIRNAAGAEIAEVEAKIAAAETAASQGRRPEYGWHSAISKSQESRKWVQIDLRESVAIERIVLAGAFDDFNGIGAGFGFPVRFRIEGSDDPEFGGTPIVFAAHDLEDYPNPGTAPQSIAAGGKSARFVRITATKLAPRQSDYIFALAEAQVFDVSGNNVALNANVTSLDSIEAPVRWARKNLTDDVYPAKTGGGEDLTAMRKRRETILATAGSDGTRRARADAALALAETVTELAKLPPAHTVYAGTIHSGAGSFAGTGANGGHPRPIFILARGQVTQPGREAGPGALSAITALPARFALTAEQPEGARRAALAQWIVDERNPLTWRSIVNRVWQYHFGRGIVDTPNDFGHMGGLPSHPELLDWLAADFRESGGSLKRLHKLIVTSAAYRQSSFISNPAAAQFDANNALLWRANRRKLEAEAVHDAVLAVSGSLDLTAGGPGWQDFVVGHPEHSPHYEYGKADPADAKTWRRAIYRFTVRSQMQPFMTALDCADPSMRVDRRNESISPSQALALLNDGFIVVQSRQFAARVEREAGVALPAQIERACRLAFGHSPSQQQGEQLIAFAKEHGLPNLCRVLFNLNEFAFVD